MLFADTVQRLTSDVAASNIDEIANLGGVTVCTVILLWVLFRENPRRDREHAKQVRDLAATFTDHMTKTEEYHRGNATRLESQCRDERFKMWEEYKTQLDRDRQRPNRRQ